MPHLLHSFQLGSSFRPHALLCNFQRGETLLVAVEVVRPKFVQHVYTVQRAVLRCYAEGSPPPVINRFNVRTPLEQRFCGVCPVCSQPRFK